MPNLKSALKRMRQNEKRRRRNQAIKTRTKNMIRKLKTLVSANKKEEAKALLPEVIKIIDQAVSKGVWHKNKAARHKSKIMKLVLG